MADTRYFNSKLFNPEAFGGYVDTIPKLNRNELIKSRAIVNDPQIKALLSTQTGSYYATIPMFGRIGGEAQNYDGQTTITADGLESFEQSIIAIGRAKAWTEKDFSFDITAGVNFMDEVAKQVAEYWDDIDTGILLDILIGIFSMTTTDKDFVKAHTYNIANDASNYRISPTTLNSAVQKACGDNRAKFSMVFMHSAVATNLENQNLLQYLKYTDANGVQRSLPLATWNGRMVIVDDGLPFSELYYEATAEDAGALKVTSTGAGANEVKLSDVQSVGFVGHTKDAVAENDYVVKDTQYVTYVLGEGAFKFAELGAKVPYEMARDAATNGGEDTLYVRRRMCFAPYGISFTKKSVATLSPTNAELRNGQNWKLVDNGKTSSSRKTIDHKSIAIAQIISRG